jgi:hypothetical protein
MWGMTRGEHAISAAGIVWPLRCFGVRRIENRRQNGNLSTLLIRMAAMTLSNLNYCAIHNVADCAVD